MQIRRLDGTAEQQGHDILPFTEARTRRLPQPPSPAPEPGRTEVCQLPSEMGMLQLFLTLDGSLQRPPATGLDRAARTVQFRKGANRWLLHATDEQMASIAYGFYLEGQLVT